MKITRLIAYLILATLLIACTPTDLGAQPAEREVPAGPVTADLFGVHFVAAWASPAALPEGVALYRIHDATHRWDRCHTGPSTWDAACLQRIDGVLLFAERYAPDAKLIYVLAGAGHAGTWYPDWTHPGNITDSFRQHVRYLAARYAGRIWALEVMNEADSQYWFTGSTALLVELTRIVREEWPGVVIAPSFTQEGLGAMAAFYLAGGGQYVDIAAFHHGIVSPERDTTAIKEAKRIAGDLPLHLTEYNVAGGAAELMRTLLVHHLFDVEAAAYYSWEMPAYGACCPGTFAHTTDSTGAMSEAGRAFLTMRDWLVGRSVVEWSAKDGLWSVLLSDGFRVEWTDSTMPSRR